MEVPQRKVAINLGVQSNFNLPYTPKEFYKPPYWDTRSLKNSKKHHHQGNDTSRHTRSLTAVGTCRDASATIEQNSLPFDDIPVESFYSYIKNYLQMWVLPLHFTKSHYVIINLIRFPARVSARTAWRRQSVR